MNEQKIYQLKVDLLSRFYPFTKSELIKYSSYLNFGPYHLMRNENIQWDIELLTMFQARLDWKVIGVLSDIDFDFEFLNKFEEKLDFSSYTIINRILWDENLIKLFGDRVKWFNWHKANNSEIELVIMRKYKDHLNWSAISRNSNLVNQQEILVEFDSFWDWKNLSLNPNLPLSTEFIQKHSNKLDFDNLSLNPASMELISKYPDSKYWNWENIVINPSIVYDEEWLKVTFHGYKKQVIKKKTFEPRLKNMEFHWFFWRIFYKQQNNFNYLLSKEFAHYIPWGHLCNHCQIELPFTLILEHKDKLDFTAPKFVLRHKELFPTDFIETNITRFNTKHYSFYFLKITRDLLQRNTFEVEWNNLSKSDKLDWSWEFIRENLDKFNLFQLSINQGVYGKLLKHESFEDTINS